MRNYFFLLLCLSVFPLAAQPLSGTYTIGGASPNYPTFTAALAALNAQGVNGPVVFTVRNGVYAESLLFTTIVGASALNTITFQSASGDSTAVELNWPTTSAQANGVFFNQASYIRLHQLTIRQLPSVNNNAVVLMNRGKYNTISNCVVWGHVTSTSSATDYVIQGNCDSNFTVINNVIRGGTTGFYAVNSFFSHRNLLVEGNTFFAINQDYMIVDGGAFAVVRNNSFDIGGSLTSTAILLTQTSRTVVSGNRIRMQTQAQNSTGIKLITCSGFPSLPIRIFNNAISFDAGGSLISYGIQASSTPYLDLAFNSVRMNGGVNSYGIYITSGSDLNLLNNVVANESTGTTNCAFYVLPSLLNVVSNYNNYYAAGPNLAPNYTSLAAYTAATGRDANSVSVLPQFNSAANLYAAAPALNNAATPLSYVLTDISGVLRGVPQPDMGAFEQLSLPVVTLGADTTLCQPLTLQAGNPGASYLWSTGATTASLTVNSSGSYWVQVTNALGSAADTIQVTIASAPVLVATTAADSVCVGGCVQLQAVATGGTVPYQFLWQPGAGLSDSTIAAPLACPVAFPAVFTVRVTDANGCAGAADTVVVNAFPAPQLTVGPPLTSCAGDTVQLNAAAVVAGSNFSWQPAALANTPLLAVTAAWPPVGSTTFTVTVTTPQGCSATATQQVLVYALPPVPQITQNGPVLLSDAPAGNQWLLNGVSISGATASSYSPTQNGLYTVLVTDSNGCSSLSAGYVMLNTGAGATLLGATAFRIVPNPVQDVAQIWGGTGQVYRLSLHDAAGRVVWQTTQFCSPEHPASLAVDALREGIYWLHISDTTNAPVVVRVVVAKN